MIGISEGVPLGKPQGAPHLHKHAGHCIGLPAPRNSAEQRWQAPPLANGPGVPPLSCGGGCAVSVDAAMSTLRPACL